MNALVRLNLQGEMIHGQSGEEGGPDIFQDDTCGVSVVQMYTDCFRSLETGGEGRVQHDTSARGKLGSAPGIGYDTVHSPSTPDDFRLS